MKNRMNNKALALVCAALVCSLGLIVTGCEMFKDPVPETAGGFEVKAKLPEEMPQDTIIDSIVAGNEQVFEALRDGNPLSPTSVTWSVEGRTADGNWGLALRPDTVIGTDGKLRVSPDESAAYLRVRASNSSTTAYSIEIRRRNANQTVVDLLSDLTEFIGSQPVLVSGEKVTFEALEGTVMTIPRRKILTIPASATLSIEDGTTHEINGVIIVKGTLSVENAITATGLGTIIVENGGKYIDGTDDRLGFFVEGPTVVKGGGTLEAHDKIWGGADNKILPFVGPTGVIRLPPDGKLTITENKPADHTLDYVLDGYGVVRGSWTIGKNENLTVRAGTTLSLENSGVIDLTYDTAFAQLILTGEIAATPAAAAKSGARIIGSGKITAGTVAISGGTGGWQVVGGAVKEDSITIAPTGTAKASIVPAVTEGDFPLLKAGAGAVITIPVSGELTLGKAGGGTDADLIVELGGNGTANPPVGGGSIVIKGSGTAGKLILGTDASKVRTGNPSAGVTPGAIEDCGSPFSAPTSGKSFLNKIAGKVGSCSANAEGTVGGGVQGLLVEITRSSGTNGEVVAGASGAIDLSSDLEVWNN